ncbi:MAG TPA: helix-turn-helix domain-containing protein [Stellaceae bacterium]|nr:helix-turn-helix domain-containing protein [Stellaceae bacterium]
MPAAKKSAGAEPTLTPVRASFYHRSMRLMSRLAATASEEGLSDALSASTDVGAVARALSNSTLLGPAIRELDPLASLIAEGVAHKQALMAEAGGLLSTAEVATLLGISRQAVYKRRQEKKLLSVPHGGEEKFPAIQFTADGRPVPGLSRLLAAVGLEGAWGTLDFLLTPDDDRLRGLSPIAMLKKHPQRIAEIVELAIAQGEHGAG